MENKDRVLCEDSHLDDFLQDAEDSQPVDSDLWLREQISEMMKSANSREVKVLSLRYGLVDGRKHTLEEVAEALEESRERIRQIEAKAIRRLYRRPARRCVFFRDYLRATQEESSKLSETDDR